MCVEGETLGEKDNRIVFNNSKLMKEAWGLQIVQKGAVFIREMDIGEMEMIFNHNVLYK